MPQYDTETMITNALYSNSPSFSISEVWVIVSLFLAVMGGIFLYNTYFSKENEDKFTGIKKFIYNFVNFKFTIIEPIFRVFYLIFAIALTLSSLSLIASNFFFFLAF